MFCFNSSLKPVYVLLFFKKKKKKFIFDLSRIFLHFFSIRFPFLFHLDWLSTFDIEQEDYDVDEDHIKLSRPWGQGCRFMLSVHLMAISLSPSLIELFFFLIFIAQSKAKLLLSFVALREFELFRFSAFIRHCSLDDRSSFFLRNQSILYEGKNKFEIQKRSKITPRIYDNFFDRNNCRNVLESTCKYGHTIE